MTLNKSKNNMNKQAKYQKTYRNNITNILA